jgi:hypothetical protein
LCVERRTQLDIGVIEEAVHIATSFGRNPRRHHLARIASEIPIRMRGEAIGR